MKRSSSLIGIVLFVSAGCNDLVRVEDSTRRVLPPTVAAVLEESCTGQAGCHADGAGGVTFDLGGAFVGADAGIAIPGDIESSQMLVVIREGTMPLPGTLTLTEQGRLVLTGWIGEGAPLVAADGSGETETGDGTTDGTTGDGTTDEGEETAAPEYDEFLPVLEILQDHCSGTACHRGAASNLKPVLEDNVAYTNLVDMPSGGGGPYVASGDSTGSFILTRMTAAMGTTQMPPAPADPVPQADIDVIAMWIDAGANL